jgi:TPR repeat protein
VVRAAIACQVGLRVEDGKCLTARRDGLQWDLGLHQGADLVWEAKWLIAGATGGWGMLGLMYEEDEAVPQDLERAAAYYRRAAQTGNRGYVSTRWSAR